MYYCDGCKHHFATPEIFVERHGFTEPPYEKIAICPFCRDTNFRSEERRRRYAK
ncbi:MAG: hypothetical protein J6B88_07365 [Clostridia bacterium]|nr:hypothetical protein [Clostridia bacterium]